MRGVLPRARCGQGEYVAVVGGGDVICGTHIYNILECARCAASKPAGMCLCVCVWCGVWGVLVARFSGFVCVGSIAAAVDQVIAVVYKKKITLYILTHILIIGI